MNKISPRNAAQIAASVPTVDCPSTKGVENGRRGKNRLRTDQEIIYQEKVAEIGCIVCRLYGEAQQGGTVIHHVREGKLRADCHYDVLPLCERDHVGKDGVHGDRSRIKKLGKTQQDLLTIIKEMLK